MGFDNPPVPWSELERTLSGRARPGAHRGVPIDGGDSPAWSTHRGAYEPPPDLVDARARRARRDRERHHGRAPAYAELHCRSNFSFLEGASHPEELVEEAARLELEALAITDRDGFYGVVRQAEAATAVGVPAVYGVDLGLVGGAPDAGRPGRPAGGPGDDGVGRVVVLARGKEGYASLATAVSRGQMAGEKGAPRLTLADLTEVGGRGTPGEGRWAVLTGGADGLVPATLMAEGPRAARLRLQELVSAFGAENVLVEVWDHGDPVDAARNDALVEMALRTGVEVVATNDVRYATPARRRLATALAAVRERRGLDDHDPWLPAAATAHLRSGAEQARRFARYPGVVERAAVLGRELAFDLHLVAPELPPFTDPDGRRVDEMPYLREVTERGATERYGARPAPGSRSSDDPLVRAWAQIDHELALIKELRYPGYFLVVWDIVRFCREQGIYCQGRGSAANSAVCYALGITAVDSVQYGLLFERFLSAERDEPPDIDIDIESGRREEVIQYVYRRHGRQHTAQVANVISYRGRSAVRDMARALGYAPGQQDAWAKQLDRWGSLAALGGATGEGSVTGPGGVPAEVDIPPTVLDLAREVVDTPRHLGIHSGGMVICDRPIVEVCPVEWARMADRSVLQWDKDDCAAIGLVKFDLLGLGMLSALHLAADAVEEWSGRKVDVFDLPPDDPEVYAMLCRADSIGVFQVESRAQMATLPRLRPRKLYDLVVEVALIRPGPIQGGSVHPYIRRRNGDEERTYPHPLTEPALEKTFGVPLFQEQLMQLAIDIAGFTAGESDQLRQAMGSKRSHRRMEVLHQRFVRGAAANGVDEATAEDLWGKLAAFANYGFPESHAVSFAYLVYASSWLKRYEPAAFCAGLLNAQPMGFYSPHSLVRDARRHGVPVRRPDVNASRAGASLETDCVGADGPRRGMGADPSQWGVDGPAVRLGTSSVRGIGDDLAEAIAAGRPYTDAEDLARRTGATLAQMEALATAGALGCFGRGRREALWAVGAVAQSTPDRLAGVVTGATAPTLPGMSPAAEASADLWATGISADGHPTVFTRADLDRRGVVTAAELATFPGPHVTFEGAAHPATPIDHGSADHPVHDDRDGPEVVPGSAWVDEAPAATPPDGGWSRADAPRVTVAGVVTHRQRPATAGGTIFVNLEDETGLVNVVVSKGCWARHRKVASSAPGLVVQGRLERAEGVANVIAERMWALDLQAPANSRDFR